MTEITKTIKQNSRIAELSNKLVHHPKKVDLYVYIWNDNIYDRVAAVNICRIHLKPDW